MTPDLHELPLIFGAVTQGDTYLRIHPANLRSEYFRATILSNGSGEDSEVRDNMIDRSSLAFFRPSWGSMVHDDYVNDNMSTAIMGRHINSGLTILPGYEGSIGQPSADTGL